MENAMSEKSVILADGDVPFKTEAAVKISMGKKGFDRGDYEILTHVDGGFAAELKDGVSVNKATAKKELDEEAPPAPKADSGSYRRVRFHSKSSENQQDSVELSVNGEVLVAERGVEVVIPQRFVDCARHATYPLFKQLPNQPRKIVGAMMLFPFDDLGEGTEDEYRKQRAAGTKANREAAESQGLLN
jgi:hypothetical protein